MDIYDKDFIMDVKHRTDEDTEGEKKKLEQLKAQIDSLRASKEHMDDVEKKHSVDEKIAHLVSQCDDIRKKIKTQKDWDKTFPGREARQEKK
jgi:hypothetical protein